MNIKIKKYEYVIIELVLQSVDAQHALIIDPPANDWDVSRHAGTHLRITYL